jgi:hypothetical protein
MYKYTPLPKLIEAVFETQYNIINTDYIQSYSPGIEKSVIQSIAALHALIINVSHITIGLQVKPEWYTGICFRF